MENDEIELYLTREETVKMIAEGVEKGVISGTTYILLMGMFGFGLLAFVDWILK